MNEEIRNLNNELSDAALEQVSGGFSVDIVQKVCATCSARTYPQRYSCTFDGGNLEKLKAEMNHEGVIESADKFKPYLCPYLKTLY